MSAAPPPRSPGSDDSPGARHDRERVDTTEPSAEEHTEFEALSLLPAPVLAGAIGEERPRPGPGRILAAVLSFLVVLVLLGYALPKLTGTTLTEIWAAVTALPLWAAPAMLLLGMLALALEALSVRTALPGARYSTALRAHAVTSAVSLAVPGGSAIGLGLMGWLLARAGFTFGALATGIIAASLVDMVLTSVLIPLLGFGAYALSGALAPQELQLPGGLWAAVIAIGGALLALVLTALLLRRGVLTALLNSAGDMVPAAVRGEILTQRDALIALLRSRAVPLVVPTLLARAAQWAALVLAIRAAGAEVPLLLTVAIFALGRVLALLPLTPGGAGITETVGAMALVALGVPAASAGAAMILLLVAMLIVPLLAGAVGAAGSVAAPAARKGPEDQSSSSSAQSSS
ncbi:lysylphosphatidylglycerol synthase transmembrane domain-containing protein [Brachybacterium sp. UMB0905]|uniref:lysylphosphatidylglycerol synthase transmembrane domain-containing protein n=1 Tax=Brachybacterium sp. UMB0905 TaxID=2069310 RepID=UPI000C7FED95|nr:lysylphosphatidylglycerol synthase transmembrane domain-containing protein [Brachybacterium sp. UMB0905]PMC75518.1 hypothetical protein CJ197_07140 [Brachybacterium sp. UMB0905]